MEHLLSLTQGGLGYIIPFILVLSLVVFVHEFGHYWVARRCGVRIETFSIGFGKEIFGWNDKHGTRWKVSWLPLGGYVKMFGDADATSSRPDETVQTLTEAEKAETFYHKTLGQRFAIVLAGPAFNYLFAIVALIILFMVSGQPYTAPVVDTVVENSPAAKVGLTLGDRVLEIDGQPTDRFEDIKRIISLNQGTPVVVKYERAGQVADVTVTPEVVQMTDRLGGEHKLGRLGITSHALDHRQLGFLTAVQQSGLEAWHLTTGTLQAVGQMILGVRGTEELGGPLRIAEMSGKVAKEGAAALFWFAAVISLNLGLINLFPIPLLDGGNLMFYAIEFVRRKALSEAAQEIGARIGLFLVLSLMVFATWNDLVHLQVVSYVVGLFS